jgi:drug/metabolite transporter (DMT)-like permease
LDKKKKAIILTILAGVCWGTSFPAIKIGLQYVDAYMFAFLRFFLAAFIVFIILLFKKKLDFKVGRNRTIWFLGIINGIGYLFQYVGMSFTSASKTSLLVNLNAIWVAILSYFMFKESLGNKKMIGILFGILGVFLITTNLNFSSLAQGVIMGDLFVLSSGIVWAFFVVYNKKLVSSAENTFESIAWVLFITVLPIIPFISLSKNASLFLPLEAWLAIIYTAVFCWIIPYYLWMEGLKHISPVTSTIILLIEIIVAVAISSIVLNEIFTLISGIGAIFILLAIILAS